MERHFQTYSLLVMNAREYIEMLKVQRYIAYILLGMTE